MVNEITGGILIGSAAALLWLGIGRISGITGVIANVFMLQQGHRNWSLLFLLGLLVCYPIYTAFVRVPDIDITNNNALLILAGLLVGAGTYIGNGCTSGHGVCGNGRLSVRSLVATLIFMTSGFVTVYIMRVTGVFGL